MIHIQYGPDQVSSTRKWRTKVLAQNWESKQLRLTRIMQSVVESDGATPIACKAYTREQGMKLKLEGWWWWEKKGVKTQKGVSLSARQESTKNDSRDIVDCLFIIAFWCSSSGTSKRRWFVKSLSSLYHVLPTPSDCQTVTYRGCTPQWCITCKFLRPSANIYSLELSVSCCSIPPTKHETNIPMLPLGTFLTLLPGRFPSHLSFGISILEMDCICNSPTQVCKHFLALHLIIGH